jgi:hypothetical protein
VHLLACEPSKFNKANNGFACNFELPRRFRAKVYGVVPVELRRWLRWRCRLLFT